MINLMIEPTNRCNLRCITCFSHSDGRKKRDMSYREFKGIIDLNRGMIGRISLYNYGEPLFNTALCRMIRYAKKNGVGFVKICTNGHLLSKPLISRLVFSGLDYISISVDGATQDIYRIFRRGGNFKKVVTNIRNLVKARDGIKGARTEIEIQFIIMRHNEHQVDLMEVLARNLGVDYLRFKTVLIKKSKWRYLLPANEMMDRYKRPGRLSYCSKPFGELVINCDGTVIPCCYITGGKIRKYSLGNAFVTPLADILESERYADFVKRLSPGMSGSRLCEGCNESSRYLDYKFIKL